jgi:hypothetical protein
MTVTAPPATVEAYDVFLSYASEDRDRARVLVAALKLHGFQVWWDREIRPGDEFSPVIQQHLDAARAVVVLWTAHSIQKSFVKEEAARASSRKTLVPVLLDPVEPPMGFGLVSHVDLRRWRGDELAGEIDRLVDGVRSVGGCEPRWSQPPPWLVLRSVYRDLKTRILVSILLFCFAAIWLLWGRLAWHVPEVQSALSLLVMGVCGVLLIRGGQLARSRVWTLAAVGLLLVAAAGWTFAVADYYEPPQFSPQDSGILIARFDRDLRDRTQNSWLQQLSDHRGTLSGSVEMDEAMRVVIIHRLRRQLDESKAHDFLRRSNALLAIWGRVGGGAAMTFGDRPGFVRRDKLPMIDTQLGTLDIPAATQRTGDLVQSILLFAAGYQAFSDGDYGKARRLLTRSQAGLESNHSGLTSATSLLATAHLLLGNIEVFDACTASEPASCGLAIDHYERAREIFVSDGGRGNFFIEASSNYAVAAQIATGSLVPSLAELEDAAYACQKLSDAPSACMFARYNLALAYSEARNYREALQMLAVACERAASTERSSGSESTFLAECRQQQAYAAAKMGESSTSLADADRHFGDALGFIEQAFAALPQGRIKDPPIKLAITRARVAVGRADFATAVRLLDPAVEQDATGTTRLATKIAQDHPELDAIEVAMLYTIARICTQFSATNQAALRRSLSAESADYFDRTIQRCRAPKEDHV